MATWIKETDQAIYLMEGGYYLDKIDKTPKPNGEQTLSIVAMHEWFARPDSPGGMVVSVGAGGPEPQPKPLPQAGIEITTAPTSVAVNEVFDVVGKTAPTNAGRSIHLHIDGNLATSAPKVESNGQWKVRYRFFGAGRRRMTFSIDGQLEQGENWLIDITAPKPQQAALTLSGSVGRSGANAPEDVLKVKERLAELGFTFFQPGSTVDSGLVQAIKLFQSIITGRTQLGGDGRIDVNSSTHQFLQAPNAPRWVLMPIRGDGFINFERNDLKDHHDYGVSWLAETIVAAGKFYEANHRKGRSNISLIPVNDVSLKQGGDTPDHAGHECGNACDLSLPKTDGTYGSDWRNSNYDRNSARAIIQALKAQPLVTRVFFNDSQLISEGLCRLAGGHDNHIHFEIGVPTKAN